MNKNGILVINKEKEWTSNDVVQKVKHLLNEKVGHTGTLDPMATGVLPLLIGKATKVSKYLINHDKKYLVTLKLGQKTTTADIEGEIIEEKDVNEDILKQENIEKIFLKFIGKQTQTPPIYSAIKVNGKKLYEYARQKKSVEIPKREIEIYTIKLQKIDKKEKQIKFQIHTSKGTYIRSVCEDIAKELGTIGYMKDLERIQVGEFNIKQSIKICELEEKINKLEIPWFITLEELLKNKESIILESQKKEDLFLNGVKLTYKKPNDTYKIYDINKKFIGIGIIQNELLKRDVIL